MMFLVFSSLEFLYLFFPLCMLFYYLAKTINIKNAVLIVFSLVFYAWGEPVYVFLMLFTVGIDYFLGLAIERNRGTRAGKVWLVIAAAVNFGLLAYFKYAGFAVESLNGVLGTSIPVPKISLPIGISFYTFQVFSYIVDVYRGDVKAQRSPLKLLLFVSLFHQLVAGPIVRYDHVAAEIENRKVTPVEISMGIDRFVVGLAKKVVLANLAGELADTYLKAKNLSEVPVLGAWFGVIMFALQIYFDFSAYSDMAIGMGRMVGFHYHENFNYPYLSRSISEFWRRWHMSLGSFFRDYVYIPLGGNRKHLVRNLFIVWGLTGLWHGASWNFVLWGLYFFVFLLLEKKLIGKYLERVPILAHLYFFFVINIGWVLFYYTDLGSVGTLLKGLVGLNGNAFTNEMVDITLKNNLFFIIFAIAAAFPVIKLLKKLYIKVSKMGKQMAAVAYVVKGAGIAGLLFLSTAMLAGQAYNPFIYFRF